MRTIAVIFFVLFCQCGRGKNTDESLKTIDSFYSSLNTKNYEYGFIKFVYQDSMDTAGLRKKVFLEQMPLLDKCMKVIEYAEAKNLLRDVKECTDSSGVYVVVGGAQNLTYIKMNGHKIYSFMPIMKGDRIVGWF